jgi:hypothetical protein
MGKTGGGRGTNQYGIKGASVSGARAGSRRPAIPAGTGGPGRFASVVFTQGDDGWAVVDMIDEEGPQAAVDHLARYDQGDETDMAADIYGHTCESAQDRAGSGSQRWDSPDGYTLLWDARHGAAELRRPFLAGPDLPGPGGGAQ